MTSSRHRFIVVESEPPHGAPEGRLVDPDGPQPDVDPVNPWWDDAVWTEVPRAGPVTTAATAPAAFRGEGDQPSIAEHPSARDGLPEKLVRGAPGDRGTAWLRRHLGFVRKH